MFSLNGFEYMEPVDRNEIHMTYRGRSMTNGQFVLIKVPCSPLPHMTDLMKLMREYEISRDLELDGILRSYRLEKQGALLALIMEDFGGMTLRNYLLSHDISIETSLPIAIQLSETLSKLHNRHIIHKDIQPGNIMIDPATCKVKVCGFGLATGFTLMQQAFEGTPAYMSPEQTGRMNRTVDHRTDLYSLGVILYEMLSGRLPFQAQDPIEWAHAHIAREPIALDRWNPAIPPMVSKIVMKLLSKAVEERYQSAYGLFTDLEKCYKQWSASGAIADFPLGLSDLPGDFHIPQKLYGREQEKTKLIEAFERVCSGPAQVMLIEGHAGIGKSSLVEEIYKPIAENTGYFTSGKFSELNRNIPYEPLIYAFRGLIAQIVSEHSKLGHWKEQLTEALGANGAVIADVIPELRKIIGNTPPVEALSPAAAQNRFQLTFRHFIRVLTTKEHPLVLFLDDLQWADNASLQLLEVLTADPESQYLFFIGAFRDHEISSSHPFALQLSRMEKSGITVHSIKLGPLTMADLNRMITDTLHCGEPESLELTGTLYRKAAGNPFFFKLLFNSVYKEQLLTYDAAIGEWEWDLERIEQMDDAQEMLEFLIGRIGKLPKGTREVLSLASCLGNRFDLNAVAFMNHSSLFRTAADLKAAILEGLVLPMSSSGSLLLESSGEMEPSGYLQDEPFLYQFVHDRILQAAYSFIGEDRRKQAHLAAGKYLLEHADPAARQGHLFEMVNHLNQSIDTAAQDADKDLLLELNILAGQKAKASSAFEAASRYFQTAIGFITEDDWARRPDYCFRLFLEHTECQYLIGSSAVAEELFELLLARAGNRMERTKVRLIQLTQYVNKGKYADAIALGLQSLQEFDIRIPPSPDIETVLAGREAIAKQVCRGFHTVMELPEATNPDVQAAMEIILALGFPTFVSDKDVFTLLISRYIELSLQYGSSPVSPVAYASYGVHLCFELGEYKAGQQLVEAAYALSEKYQLPSIQGKVLYMLGKVLNRCERTDERKEAYFSRAVELCLDAGDFIFTGLAMTDHVSILYTHAKLDDVHRLVQTYLPIMAQTKNPFRILTFYNYLQFISDLRGLTSDITTLDIEQLNEHSFSKEIEGQEFRTFQYFRNFTFKTQIHYLLGNYMEAIQAAEAAVPFLQNSRVLPHLHEHCFYYSLAISSAWDSIQAEDKHRQWTQLEENQRQMELWTNVNPQYYLHKSQLMAAEMARIAGDESKAISLYHQSIVAAREGGYIQNEAIASELFAKLYLAKGIDKVAQVYMTDAYEGFRNWGASVKVSHLLNTYPHLLRAEPAAPEHTMQTAIDAPVTEWAVSSQVSDSSDEMDLASILKAAQSFSEEIDLEQLLLKLMSIIIENAGAQKGCLLVDQGGELLLEVIVQTDDSVLPPIQSVPADRCDRLSLGVVRHVARTLNIVSLDDARLDDRFREDAYIRKERPKSILCLPVTKPSHPNLILYLENNLTTHAFPADRAEVLQMLSFQVYYVKTLLHSYGKTTIPIQTNPHQKPAPLVDQLTVRELEVLNLMAKGLSNQEIGQQLGVVVGTVKNHIKNIFSKLEVNKRIKAVAQAKELNLLDKDAL